MWDIFSSTAICICIILSRLGLPAAPSAARPKARGQGISSFFTTTTSPEDKSRRTSLILSISILITTLFAFVRRSRTGTADIVDTIHVECASCRWVGEVPRLRKRCPMCGANNFTT